MAKKPIEKEVTIEEMMQERNTLHIERDILALKYEILQIQLSIKDIENGDFSKQDEDRNQV